MIPTAILAGLLLGLWLRWWAVPVVGAAWGGVVAFFVALPSGLSTVEAFGGAAALGTANALVGVAVAVGMRRMGGLAGGRRRADHAR